MALLIDTHLALWAAYEPARLPERARALISDPDQTVYLSAVSLWEIAIKSDRHPALLPVDLPALHAGFLAHGWTDLPITAAHAIGVKGLPALHSDPFDRMLFSQARAEGARLLTSDTLLARYGPPAELV